MIPLCLFLYHLISCLPACHSEEVAIRSYLPLPLGEVAERSEDGEGQ